MSNNKSTRYLLAAEELRKNKQQFEAYNSTGHCVVLAGPGSGKTKVLTTKMARMLVEDVRAPRGIACITYNNQCVKELRKRLTKLGVEESSRIFIGTVHSFCLNEVLLPFAKFGGLTLPEPISVATETEQQKFFAAAVNTVIGNENPDWLRTPFDEFRRTVLDRQSPEWLNSDRYAPLIIEYEALLAKAGKIDFDQMALLGLRLIQNNPWICKALKARYPILVVDEYQDLGIPLHRIVLNLCIKCGIRLFAVGDPDQSIYGFTGARPALMNELANLDEVEDVHLRLNYRCGKTIIAASTTALAEARDFEAAEEHEGFVQDWKCPGGFEDQVSFAVKTLIPDALGRRQDRTLGDIGVLYHSQYDGEIVAKAMDIAGISYVRFDQGIPYRRTPLILWLEECACWCAGGWKLGDPKLSALLKRWRRFNPSALRESEILASSRSVVRFLFAARNAEMLLRDWLKVFVNAGALDRITNEPTMADEIEAFDGLSKACDANKPLAEYTVANFGGQRGSSERLNLTTIHSAKGLEYDVVIMLGLEQGRIPYYNASPDKEKESRRLFYVAMTRARHEVHLLWSGWYVAKGNRYSNGRSKFVGEIMKKLQPNA